MSDTQELLQVEQSDRDAAADVWCLNGSYSSHWIRETRAGHHDSQNAVQAFARHRLAHSTPPHSAPMEAIIDLKMARANWAKYADEPGDEFVYQANKMAAAIDRLLSQSAQSAPVAEGEAGLPINLDGYVDVFYEIADLMSIPARSAAPKHVWENEMRPMLKTALSFLPKEKAALSRTPAKEPSDG